MNLEDKVTVVKSISDKSEALLAKLNIHSVKDLLTYFPVRYLDTSETVTIEDLISNANTESDFLIKANIKNFSSNFIPGGRTIQRAILFDETGEISTFWFNQRFLANAFKLHKEFYFFGRIKQKGKKFVFYPKTFEKVVEQSKNIHLGRIIPEYRLTSGVSKKTFRRWIANLVEKIEDLDIQDPISLNKEEVITALKNIHYPKDYQSLDKSLELLSKYEFVNIFLRMHYSKKKESKAIKINNPDKFNTDNIFKLIESFLPYKLTDDQERIIKEIFKKIKNGESINQIIQGDVGSGKTIIGLAATTAMAMNGFQSIIIVPTTVLANQHFNTFKDILDKLKITVELVSSANKKTSSAQVIIGTSAVLARKSDLITNPGIIIVDEQHKFGVKQREELLLPILKKNTKVIPHYINLTATPIPRSIAQIIFDGVDLEVIKTKPIGRLPIKTLLVAENKREDSYKWISEQIKQRKQVFWVCPLIFESETLEIKSAEETLKELTLKFKDYKVGLLHGKLKEGDKLDILAKFKNQELDILVSTSVIEVGIDIANATVIVIESAERFGLAQIHQIRGRVGRGVDQSWCLLFYSKNITENSLKRLQFISKNNDGLKIAEFDLLNRGPGEIYGTQQSGIPNLKIAKLSNMNILNEARQIAKQLILKKIKSIPLFN